MLTSFQVTQYSLIFVPLQNSYQYSHHPHHHNHHHDGRVVKLEPELEGREYSFHAQDPSSGPHPPPPQPPGPNAPDLPPGAIVAAIRQSAAAAAGRRPMMYPVDMDANEVLKVKYIENTHSAVITGYCSTFGDDQSVTV